MPLTRAWKISGKMSFPQAICHKRTLVRDKLARIYSFPENFPHFILFHRGAFPEFPHACKRGNLSTKRKKFSLCFSLFLCGKTGGEKISSAKGFSSFPTFQRGLLLLPLPYLNFSFLERVRKKERLLFFVEKWKTQRRLSCGRILWDASLVGRRISAWCEQFICSHRGVLRRGSAVSFRERNVSGRRTAYGSRLNKIKSDRPARSLLLFATFSFKKRKLNKSIKIKIIYQNPI